MNKIIKESKSYLRKDLRWNPLLLLTMKSFNISYKSSLFTNNKKLNSNNLEHSINSIYQFKPKINYLLFKMISESDNKRVLEGTKHTLNTSQKIGGIFKSQTNAPFISKRAALFDKLFADQKKSLRLY